MREWYNENEGRAYPLREDAPRLDALGRKLPDDIIVDLAVSIPNTVLDTVYVTSLALSTRLVSIVVGTASEGLLVGTYVRPVPIYTPLPLAPLAGNVSGFVVFGSGSTGQEINYRFSSVAQTPLEIRALRVFDALPVEAIGKIGVANLLDGIIQLEFGTNVEWRYDAGSNTIYIGLQEGVRDDFVGPCARAKSIAGCGIPPIRSINGVVADVNGAIFIEVQ
jgi:hypothetical protein